MYRAVGEVSGIYSFMPWRPTIADALNDLADLEPCRDLSRPFDVETRYVEELYEDDPMITKNDSHVLSVHHRRQTARDREREIQALLDTYWDETEHGSHQSPYLSAARKKLDALGVPYWARGVKAERVGNLLTRWVQFGVVATYHRGR